MNSLLIISKKLFKQKLKSSRSMMLRAEENHMKIRLAVSEL